MSTPQFDDVVALLIETCERLEAFSCADKALIVRDIAGRLRLVLEGAEPHELRALPTSLEPLLNESLRGWFVGPVLTTADRLPGRRRLAQQLMEGADEVWPLGWPTRLTDPFAAELVELPGARWTSRQAMLSKSPWLTGRKAELPWPLLERTPRITAFYSFKGGVGRSTTLGILATRLAMMDKKVVVIDLDLEAPGLSALLTAPDAQPPKVSVLDYLLYEGATGSKPESLPVVEVEVYGAKLSLVPAGTLNSSYLERLSRLDTLGREADGTKSPVLKSLTDLLKRIRSELNPDHVFIDCRTGLNDLGGVALTDLAHVDVWVGRDGRADLEGMSLVLETLARRREPADQRLLTLQSFVPMTIAEVLHSNHTEAQYQVFQDHWYPEDEIPPPTDSSAPHFPYLVHFFEGLMTMRWLGQPGLAFLWEEPRYTAILERLAALWAPEPRE